MTSFTTPPALAGGLLIGIASVWLLAVNGGIAHKFAFDPPAESGKIHASESEAEHAP